MFSGTQGLITNFTGGKYSAHLAQYRRKSSKKISSQLNRIFPGIAMSAKQVKQSALIGWENAIFRVLFVLFSCNGQASPEQKKSGRELFFAGEHCSVEAQGYMEGGCASGEEAARNIAIWELKT
jgi:monoamine oxidase